MKMDESTAKRGDKTLSRPSKAPDSGTILQGKVSGMTSYRVFISLPDKRTGVVHISEISESYVKDIRDFLTIGDTVRAMVLSAEPDGRINLSIKRARPSAPPPPPSAPREQSGNFEDRLNRFMRESEDRLLDVKRNREHHRSGSRRQ